MSIAKFPTKLGELNSYYTIAVPYLETNMVRLNVTQQNVDELNLLFDDPNTSNAWTQLWALTINTATATQPLRAQRNTLITTINDKLKLIYGDITASALTETDRSTLRIFARDTTPTARGPIPTAPDVAFTPLEGGNVKQRLRVDEDASRASIHPLSDGWERASKIGGTPPITAADCPLTNTGTEALSTIHGGQENDGLRLYAFVRWINLSNPANNGPWSPIEVATISAGTLGS